MSRPPRRLDNDYQRDEHMPLIESRMGDDWTYYSVKMGYGRRAGSSGRLRRRVSPLCDSVESYSPRSARTPGSLADMGNFTDLALGIQISEVVVENSAGS